MRLGGNATITDLTNEYNKIHFPRNINYKDLNVKDVRKTMQGDVSKLIRDKMIKRVITRPPTRLPPNNRLITTFHITEYGYKNIHESQQLKNKNIEIRTR